MNAVRLERSLVLLRRVNDARFRFSGWAGRERVRHAEEELKQHDVDCRERVNAGQLTIFSRIDPKEYQAR